MEQHTFNLDPLEGAATLSITAFSITTLSIMTYSIMDLFMTFSINDIQHI